MQLLHIIDRLSTGGTEHLLVKHVEQLAHILPEATIKVVVLGTQDNANGGYLKRLPCTTTFMNFSGRYRNPLASAHCVWRLRQLIKNINPSLLHSYHWNSNVFTEISRKALSIPHVVHVVDRRGDINDTRWIARSKVRFTGHLFRQPGLRFAAVSEACREHAIRQWKIDPQSIVTAHNGIPVVELQSRERVSSSGLLPVLGTISNFTEEKGHRYLFEALALLKDQGLNFPLRIAGYGRPADQNRLESLVARLALEDQVTFVGGVPSAEAFYRSIDLFVAPSIFAEGLPTTILEAMASGLPVIVSDVGGAIEAVRDGVEGLIVPPRNAAALAAAIDALGRDPGRWKSMGIAGFQRARDAFSIEKMTGTIVDQIYRPLLNAQFHKST